MITRWRPSVQFFLAHPFPIKFSIPRLRRFHRLTCHSPPFCMKSVFFRLFRPPLELPECWDNTKPPMPVPNLARVFYHLASSNLGEGFWFSKKKNLTFSRRFLGHHLLRTPVGAHFPHSGAANFSFKLVFRLPPPVYTTPTPQLRFPPLSSYSTLHTFFEFVHPITDGPSTKPPGHPLRRISQRSTDNLPNRLIYLSTTGNTQQSSFGAYSFFPYLGWFFDSIPLSHAAGDFSPTRGPFCIIRLRPWPRC